MALQHHRPREGDDEHDPPWMTDDEEGDGLSLSSITHPPIGIPMELPTEAPISYPVDGSDLTSKARWRAPHTEYPVHPSTDWPDWPYTWSSSTSTWTTQKTKSPYGPYWEYGGSSTSFTTPTLVATIKEASPSASVTHSSGGQRPNWQEERKHISSGTMYAAASIVPIIVLAIIGGLAFLCLRKRRRQRHAALAAQMAAQEMKMQPPPTIQPYLAPSTPTILPHYATSSSHPPTSTSLSAPPPVILGPIPSGANGAYLTGIDTSDVVSVTSNNYRQADPFSDSNLSEPPPPYRPRSVAPPSFVSASRHSSFRVPEALPETSQTHLIERSPFEDPDEDDAISELSGPIGEGGQDGMSDVSDLSYQRDPVVGRSSL